MAPIDVLGPRTLVGGILYDKVVPVQPVGDDVVRAVESSSEHSSDYSADYSVDGCEPAGGRPLAEQFHGPSAPARDASVSRENAAFTYGAGERRSSTRARYHYLATRTTAPVLVYSTAGRVLPAPDSGSAAPRDVVAQGDSVGRQPQRATLPMLLYRCWLLLATVLLMLALLWVQNLGRRRARAPHARSARGAVGGADLARAGPAGAGPLARVVSLRGRRSPGSVADCSSTRAERWGWAGVAASATRAALCHARRQSGRAA